MRANKGFTLVEILIVVVILGILAAIVIPQFTDASDEAKEATVRADLQTIRGQIELFKAQHTGGILPGNETADDTTFVEAMTESTSAAGSKSGSTYGPYLYAIPSNPYNDLATVEVDGTIGNSSHGWHWNSTTGVFVADDNNTHAAW